MHINGSHKLINEDETDKKDANYNQVIRRISSSIYLYMIHHLTQRIILIEVSELAFLLLKITQANLHYSVYFTESFLYQANLQHFFIFAKRLNEKNITTLNLGNFYQKSQNSLLF